MSLVTPLETQAAVIEDVRKMHSDLTEAQATIRSLQFDLGRASDQIALLSDERVRLRKEVNIYRSKLLELATATTNIWLLAGVGKEIMTVANDLLERVDGHEENTEDQSEAKRAAVAASISAIDQAIAGSGNTEVETVSERPPILP